jgi:multidrug resistance protein MdtO
MTVTTTLEMPGLMGSKLLEFLRRELAPTPGRWQATLRITLVCIACTIPIMSFHLKVPLIVMTGVFLVASEDTTTTLMGTVIGLAGVTIGCGLLLLYYMCAVDITWLRVLCVPTFIAFGLLINRIVTLGPVGSSIGVPLALGMIIPDIVHSTEYLARFPFYAWWALVLGLSVNLAVQYLLNPQTIQSLLVRGLTSRLDAVESFLRRLAAGETADSQHTKVVESALTGVMSELRLMKVASVAEPWLKENQVRVRAQFILADRLVTAAAVLEVHGVGSSNELVQQRLRRVADACSRWRTAVKDHQSPEVLTLPAESGAATDGHGVALPSLAEMERVIELMPFTFRGRELPDELKPPLNEKKSGLLVPDAFTNPEYLHSAIKGALAGFICYLIFTLFDYEGVYTSIITCIVCSLSTVGASLQKGVMRFAGAAVGGVLGLISLVYIFPHLDSLGGFWFPFGAATGLAAYVNRGSPRISYCGYQIALAFYKCVLQSYGPYTELRVVRDRLIGIVLGLVVFGLIDRWLWPVKALETTRAKLASVLRSLAKLAGLPDKDSELASELAGAYALRLQVYQDIGTLRQLFESSRFEPGAPRRERLEEIAAAAQRVFLHLLAIIQHRPDVRPSAVPELLRAASFRFRVALADVILNFSDQVEGKPERPMPDLPSALAELEHAVAAQTNAVTDANLAAQIRGRLELYRETVPITMKLARLQAG